MGRTLHYAAPPGPLVRFMTPQPPRNEDEDENDEDAADDLPNPMEIVLDRIFIERNETLGGFLHRLQEEEEQLIRYARSPLSRIQAPLRAAGEEDEDSLSESDNALFDYIMRRQMFNWLPNIHTEHRMIKTIQVESRSDFGLQWDCAHVGVGRVKVNASPDNA
ncbi:MAG: hypothetical protein ASARMPRED_004678 [Alectoria sarmentosa]|nr:MAG: hypothetical protein ASARMPRED_004678 [Alectoria sarmentosa]